MAGVVIPGVGYLPRISNIVGYTQYPGETRYDPYISNSWGDNADQHYVVWNWDAVNNHICSGGDFVYNGEPIQWLTLYIRDIPAPIAPLFDERLLNAIGGVFGRIPGQGTPIRATLWWRGTHHVLGVATLYDYVIFLEYDVIELIPLLAGILAVIGAFVGLAIMLKMLGFDAGSVNALAATPFSGMVWVFMLGTAFLVALTYYQQHAGIKSPVRPAVPKTPSMTATAPLEYVGTAERVAKGAIPTVATVTTRRRR